MRAFRVGLAGFLFGGNRTVSAQTIQLPQITINAPSPIQRAPAPEAHDSLQGTLLQGTLRDSSDRPVRHRHRDAERRNPAQHRRNAWRRAANPSPASPRPAFRRARRAAPWCEVSPSRPRIQENGLGVNDVSDLSDDHAVPIDPLSARQVEVIRGPATLPLRLAGDRRRGQRRQQPNSDLHLAARLCRRSQRRADQCRQRRRGRRAINGGRCWCHPAGTWVKRQA